jgi:outer membrane protein TolC
MIKRLRLGVFASFIAFSGCAVHKQAGSAPPSAPDLVISQAQSLAARTLDAPELQQWMTSSGWNGPASWPLPNWDFSALTLAGYYYSPDLDVARAEAAAATAAITTAGMKPNPSLSLGPGYETAPESPYLMTMNFSWLIETAGKRRYRLDSATHMSEASREQLALTAWMVRGRVRAAVTDLVFAEKSADFLRREESLQSKYAEVLQARFQAGEIPLPDANAAQIELTNIRQALKQAQGQIISARASLAAAIGVPAAALVGKTVVWNDAESLPAPAKLPDNSARAKAVENRLDVLRALAQYKAAQSRLQLELSRRYPDINLGPGYAFEEGAHLISLELGAILPLRNHNEGPIAEAEAQRKVAGAQFLSTQNAVIADTDRALAQYDAAYAVWTEAQKSADQVQAQSQTAHKWLESGEADRLVALSADLQTAIAERARLDALHQAQLALGALEEAVEHPIEPTAEPSLPRAEPRKEKLP